jgi:integrase
MGVLLKGRLAASSCNDDRTRCQSGRMWCPVFHPGRCRRRAFGESPALDRWFTIMSLTVNQNQAGEDPLFGSSISRNVAVVENVGDAMIDAGRSAVTRAEFGLSESAAERIARSVPEETRRAYAGDWGRFQAWAAAQDPAVPVLPAGNLEEFLKVFPAILANYATHLADRGKAPSTIERAMAAIAAAHKTAGLPAPVTTLARAVLRDHKRELALAGRKKRKATPVTITVLRAMVAILIRGQAAVADLLAAAHTTLSPVAEDVVLSGIQLRDRLVIVLGFALGTRRSSVARLNIADVTVTGDGLEVWIATSKTDKESVGLTVFIPHGEHPDTCPVRCFEAWRDYLAAQGIATGPLFVRVDRHGRLGHVATGRGAADGRITGQAVAIIVNRTAKAAGLDPKLCWSGHSLRRGMVTESYNAGATLLRIGRHAGFVDGSRALPGYVEDIDRKKDNPLKGIGL